jgi:hypothetical protein
MVHYRVTLFLAALFLAYLITYPLIPEPMYAGRRKYVLLLLIFVAGLSLFFVAPWLYQSIKIAVLPKVIVTSSGKIPFFQDFSWAFLTAALGRQTLVLAGLALLWSILKGQRFPWMLISWIFILFFFANLGALKLPGGSLVTSSSAEIMLFIPISILGGYIIDNLISMWRDLLPGKFHIPYFAASTIIICLIAYLGAKQLVSIINPITVLSRRADIPAISWIENNIPETEKIVINPFAWGYGIYAGSDGGYWIAPLAGRITLPPPVLYGLGNQVKSINNLTQNMLNLNADPVAFRNYLLENNIQYVYTGAKGGVISPKKLNNSGLFTTLYHTDGVWIFQVKP